MGIGAGAKSGNTLMTAPLAISAAKSHAGA
jgi:hypothetical protein